jgi:hypothetical protein
MRTASIIGASVLVAACLPAPHQHYFAPQVAGVVMEGGTPVANAEIELTGKFTDRKAMVRSDGEGHFTLDPIAELPFIQWLIGDPLFGYNLNITVGEHTYLGLSEFGLGYAPSHIEVRCDLSRPGGTGRTPVACPHNH